MSPDQEPPVLWQPPDGVDVVGALHELICVATGLLAFLYRERLAQLTGTREGSASDELKAITSSVETARTLLREAPTYDVLYEGELPSSPVEVH